MGLKTPYARTTQDSTVVDLSDRVSILERMTCGRWRYVGETDEPAFQNGWHNVGGDLVPMRFRLLLGCGVEIQGSVTGGATGTVVFTLPDEGYRPDYELRLVASDDTGDCLVFRVLTTGNVVAGV